MRKFDLRKKYVICNYLTGEIIYEVDEYSKIRRGFGEDMIVIERDGKVGEVYYVWEVSYDKYLYVEYKYNK